MEHVQGFSASQAREMTRMGLRSGHLIVIVHIPTFLFMQWWHLTSVIERWRQCACMRDVSLLTKATDSNVNPRRVHEAWIRNKGLLPCKQEIIRMAQGSGLQFMMCPIVSVEFDVLRSWNEGCEGDQVNQSLTVKYWKVFPTYWFICNQSWQWIFRNCPRWTCFHECATLHLDTISSSLLFSLY